MRTLSLRTVAFTLLLIGCTDEPATSPDAALPVEDASTATDAGFDVVAMDAAEDIPPAIDRVAVDAPTDRPSTMPDVTTPSPDVAAPPPDVGTDASRCPAGQTVCGTACVALATDPMHCGACATACPARRLCNAGACTGEQRSCPPGGERGCGLVEITGGTFEQGDATLSAEMYASPVQPMITVSDFAVDAYEVTVGRFRRFWDAGHPDLTADVPYPGGPGRWILGESDRVTEPDREIALGCDWSRDNLGREFLPLVCIDAATAQCFCVWDGGRLATESEWEYLAKARPIAGLPSPRRYPWGNHTENTQCVVAQFGVLCPGARELGYAFREVGSYPAIGGIYDLAGNVEELTANRLAEYWEPSVWGGIPRTDPFAPAARNSLGRFVFRGGGFWEESFNRMNVSSRRPIGGDQRGGAVGFRCVRSHPRS